MKLNKQDRIIIQTAAEVYGTSVDEISSKKRTSEVVRARFFIWKFMRDNLNYTLKEIGRKFDKDHTTIIHGIEDANSRLEYYSNDKKVYKQFINSLNNTELFYNADQLNYKELFYKTFKFVLTNNHSMIHLSDEFTPNEKRYILNITNNLKGNYNAKAIPDKEALAS